MSIGAAPQDDTLASASPSLPRVFGPRLGNSLRLEIGNYISDRRRRAVRSDFSNSRDKDRSAVPSRSMDARQRQRDQEESCKARHRSEQARELARSEQEDPYATVKKY